MADDEILRERFVRWQTATREQLGYAINLILAFAGATIGFELTTLLNERFILSRCENNLYFASLSFRFLSMIAMEQNAQRAAAIAAGAKDAKPEIRTIPESLFAH
jgi:hypothetical protein